MRMSALLLLACLTGAAPAQTLLETGDVAVVTSNGYYRVSGWPAQGPPINYLPPSAFGLTDFVRPSIVWEYGTQSMLLCTGTRLFRVTHAATGLSITDLSPAAGPAAAFTDADLHPGNGRLLLLDRAAHQALFFDPPFAAGMAPVLVLPLPNAATALCVDSRQYPEAILYGKAQEVERRALDGATSTETFLARANALDDDPQYIHRTFVVQTQGHKVMVSQSIPTFVQPINLTDLCAPVALSPLDVVYDPASNFTYVLAAGGVNAFCMPGVAGSNHVVALPPAQGAVPPRVITQPSDSGITGTDGALALVTPDFAFSHPYGPVCNSPSGNAPSLAPLGSGVPAVGNQGFGLALEGAPPLRPVLLVVGFAPQDGLLAGGCHVLVQPTLVFLAGTTTQKGTLSLPGGIPAGVPLGMELFVQAAVLEGSAVVTTQGLLLHVGLP